MFMLLLLESFTICRKMQTYTWESLSDFSFTYGFKLWNERPKKKVDRCEEKQNHRVLSSRT